MDAAVLTNVYEDNCSYPISSLSFLANESFDPEYLQLVWPCEVRSYWVHINPFVHCVKFLLTYVTIFIVIIGLIMNTLTFLILNSPPMCHTSLSVFLRALAISDNGALLFNFASGVGRSHIEFIANLYLENIWLCGINKVLVDLFLFNSTWLVVGITVKRLLVIGYPLKFALKCSVKTAKKIVLFISLITLSIACLKLRYSGYEQDSTFGFKACKFKSEVSVNAIYFYIAFSTWLPCLLIFIGNILLIIQVQNSNKQRFRLYGDRSAVKRFIDTHRMMTLLIAVSLTCLTLLFPLGITETFELYWDAVLIKKPATTGIEQQQYIRWQQEKLLLKWIRGLFFWLYQWNFAINFFLYCLTGRKFRLAARDYLKNNLFTNSYVMIRDQLAKLARSRTTEITDLTTTQQQQQQQQQQQSDQQQQVETKV